MADVKPFLPQMMVSESYPNCGTMELKGLVDYLSGISVMPNDRFILAFKHFI